MKTAHLLFHTHQIPDGEENMKLSGVYATSADATSAQQRALSQPGFKDHANGFTIDAYQIGNEHWADGFQPLAAISGN